MAGTEALSFTGFGIGAFLIYAGVKNNSPVQLVKDAIAEPKRFREILTTRGTWASFDTPAASDVLPGDNAPGSTSGGTSTGKNGDLSGDQLQGLSWAPGQSLSPAAAASLEKLNGAYRARFGSNLTVTGGYRSLAGQIKLKAQKPGLAAKPGTSNHGLGIAADLGGGIQRFGSEQHSWMVANAPTFGWRLPSWAQRNGAKPEPWHWEFQS